jgi:hypothetical protein
MRYRAYRSVRRDMAQHVKPEGSMLSAGYNISLQPGGCQIASVAKFRASPIAGKSSRG